ncbi:hypothetical protein Tco_1039930 [Tanacetum coccineum]
MVEERETIKRQVEEKGEADSKCLIRELITNPITLLALQVTGHLKQVAIQTNVMAILIFGGIQQKSKNDF